jgi:hypothetical protein
MPASDNLFKCQDTVEGAFFICSKISLNVQRSCSSINMTISHAIDYRRASGREPRYPQVLYPPTFYIIICDFNFFYSHITDLIAFLLRVFSYHRYYAPSSSRLDLENYQGGFQYLLLHHYY